MATTKIKRAIAEIGVNGGNISKAMRTVGYAPSTAARTDKLVRRKGFKELMEKVLPDSLLLKVHQEGLEATTHFSEGLGKGESVLVEKPDYSVRHKYLESGYKIKGKYKEVETPNTSPSVTLIQINMPNGTESHTIQSKS